MYKISLTLLVILLTIIFSSCSNPLENKYNKVSVEKDMLALKENITTDQFNELAEYIALSSFLGVDITGKTYNELLDDIETSKNNEIKRQNSYTRINIKELLNQRLQNDMCDDYILEMNKKGIHPHNEKKNDSIEWYEESYYLDY